MQFSKVQTWRNKLSKLSPSDGKKTKRKFALKACLMAFFVYTIFAVDLLKHGSENSLKIFYLKLLVVAFMASKFILKWSPGFFLTRKVSQFTAFLTSIKIPVSLRKPIYSTFADQYGIITKDMVKPYKAYPTFNSFFTRTVKPRFINPSPAIAVSPADSKVLSLSQVTSNECLLVKGIKYQLGHFLTGLKDYRMDIDELNAHHRMHEGSTIHSCILYLAPGDYHRYHCPVEYVAKGRTHIIGSLAPVKESYISKTPGVYEGNERVVLQGEWKGGFMFITFVGAMNVGSMTVNFDSNLNTNQSNYGHDIANVQSYNQREFTEQVQQPYVACEEGVQVPKGAEMGRFNMGSTVVLVFESKLPIRWNVRPGDKVRYGQPLFTVEETQ